MAQVLVLGSYSPSLVRFRGALIKQLVTSGHSVLACGPEDMPCVQDWMTAHGARFEPVQLSRTGTSVIDDLGTVRGLAKILRKWRPSHLLAYTAKPVVYGAIAERIYPVSHFCAMITGLGSMFLGDSSSSSGVRLALRALYRHAMSRADSVIFQNKDDLQDFVDLGLLKNSAKAQIVAGSGIDVRDFPEAELPDNLSFLLIARLIKDKGIVEFVEAARQVRSKYPGARFRVVGWLDSNPSSVTREDLDTWIREGLIEYVGEVADVRPALRDCLVYVLPSYREGMPRTVLEAMSTGRPIITTDVPGCRDTVIEGLNGYLVPPRDADALACAMVRAIESRHQLGQMGHASRVIAEERFDVRQVNTDIMRTMGL